MTEVRMRLRHKGQQFPSQDLENFLIGFGDDTAPLPSTIKVLDEIVTDYIIESCHEAAAVAHHARRQKIKLDDFKFMLRRDTAKLGKVTNLLEMDKELKRVKKQFDTDEGIVVKGRGAGEDDADEDGVAATGGGKGGKGGDEEGGRSVAGKRGARSEADGGEKKKKRRKKEKGSVAGDAAGAVRGG